MVFVFFGLMACVGTSWTQVRQAPWWLWASASALGLLSVALLMATMTPLKFLILDEHTAALDPKTAEVIMALTDRVIREKHLTAMMVTHNLRYAVEYGDRILMMNRGRVVLDRAGAEKRATSMDDILTMFNQISLETGN